MFNLGPMELVVILVLALLIFGPGKLPEVGQALGKSLNEFRRAARAVTEEPARKPPSASSAGPVQREQAPPPASPEGQASSGQAVSQALEADGDRGPAGGPGQASGEGS